MTSSAQAPPQRAGQDDRYNLQGLLWCAISDQAMTPVDAGAGVRQYRCPDPECPRRVVLAEMAERLVWDQIAFLNDAIAHEIGPERRREALRHVLTRVWVGKEIYDLYYEWRD